MKEKLTKEELAVLLPHIQRVLDTGKDWEDEKLHHPTGAIINAVASIKGVKKVERNFDAEKEEDVGEDGFSTNGWQYDWWQRFTYKDKEYTLSGSGYYGGHHFGLSE